MVEYTDEGIYLESCTTNQAKLVAINTIIDRLMAAAAGGAGNEGISEYWLDDGQTKIKKVYRSTASIFSAIQTFEQLKEMYINKINGRVVRLVDHRNFIGPRNGR